MKKSLLSPAAWKAVFIGGLCAIAYLAVYVARDSLSAATPQMTQSGAFTTAQIGSLSSTFFITYAIGQLINGYIGDKIKSKYMISFGLLLGSLGFYLLPQLAGTPTMAYTAYGASGFFLAMIYGPMTKVVAENTEPIYATRCSVGYTLASLLGSPIAGLLAASLVWDWVFRAAGGLMMIMGCVVIAVFTLFEKKGMIRYNQFQPAEKGVSNIRLLIQRDIIKFTIISVLTGVIRTAVVFWLPTYISSYLGFDPNTSALIFSGASLGISLSALLAVAIYEALKRNMDLTILLSFIAAAVSFLLVFLIKQPIINIICMVLAILAANCASNMMWSRYCPSLYDTGMVSGATGFLDFCSYMAASAASALFANAVSDIGWGPLILIWFGLMAAGVIVSLPWKKRKVVSE